jgi:hypothetical protein
VNGSGYAVGSSDFGRIDFAAQHAGRHDPSAFCGASIQEDILP